MAKRDANTKNGKVMPKRDIFINEDFCIGEWGVRAEIA